MRVGAFPYGRATARAQCFRERLKGNAPGGLLFFARQNIVTEADKVYKPPVPRNDSDAPFPKRATNWEGGLNNPFLRLLAQQQPRRREDLRQE